MTIIKTIECFDGQKALIEVDPEEKIIGVRECLNKKCWHRPENGANEFCCSGTIKFVDKIPKIT